MFFGPTTQSNKIDICCINETWLLDTHSLYIRGFKIYRANAGIKRRGCAILISSRLNSQAQPIRKDPEGRYLKLKLKANDNSNSFTIATIYLEPDKEHHPEVIPQDIFESDIILGDLNQAITGYTKYERVYHVKGIETLDHIEEIPKGISDHNMIILQYQTHIEYRQLERKTKILDKKICQYNTDLIMKAVRGQKPTEPLINPQNEITIHTGSDSIDNANYEEEYKTIQKVNREKFKTEQATNMRRLKLLMTNDKLSREPYINK